MSDHNNDKQDLSAAIPCLGCKIGPLVSYGQECHRIAWEHGFWPIDRHDAECIALMHSEISEALEALRDGNPVSEKLGDPITQVEEELADLIIRVLDYAYARGLNLDTAVIKKMEYNDRRPYKHGKEF